MADGAVTSFAGGTSAPCRGVLVTTWTAFAGVTTSIPISAPHYPDKTISATGTWGGATLVVNGSGDGTTYVGLNDSRGEGNAVSMTADNLVTILENPRYIQVKTTGGTGTSLVVTITAVRLR